jgi:hypothetical protein
MKRTLLQSLITLASSSKRHLSKPEAALIRKHFFGYSIYSPFWRKQPYWRSHGTGRKCASIQRDDRQTNDADMKLRITLLMATAIGLFQASRASADDLFQLFWRGTYYTKNESGHIIAVPFTEQDFVNKVAQDNGLDPSGLIFVYRPNRRDTVVVRSNGAFVADVIQLEYVYTDVTNPTGTVTVRQALLFDENHQNALGSWMGLELSSRDPQGNLQNDQLTGWMQYSIPETDAVYGGQAFTGNRVVDNSGAPP